MRNEITTTPDALVLDTRVPWPVIEWAFKRGEPRVRLHMSDTGIDCYLRSGAITMEFDAIGSGRPLADRARDELLRMTGRERLAQVPGSLVGATLARIQGGA